MYSAGEIIFPKRLTNCSASQDDHNELYAPLSKSKAKRVSECVNQTSTSGTKSKLRRKGDRLIDLLDPEVVIFFVLISLLRLGCTRFYSIGLGKQAFAPLAQLAEQVTLNHWVAGSIPARCRIPTAHPVFSPVPMAQTGVSSARASAASKAERSCFF